MKVTKLQRQIIDKEFMLAGMQARLDDKSDNGHAPDAESRLIYKLLAMCRRQLNDLKKHGVVVDNLRHYNMGGNSNYCVKLHFSNYPFKASWRKDLLATIRSKAIKMDLPIEISDITE